jgi:hypothetical protein
MTHNAVRLLLLLGTLADANTRGWRSRFFTSKWMPF